jgi:hypothetical protein
MKKQPGDTWEEFEVWCGPSALMGQRATREEAKALLDDIAAGRVRPDLGPSEREALNIRPIVVSEFPQNGRVTWVRELRRPKPSNQEVEAFLRSQTGGRDARLKAAKDYFGDSITRKQIEYIRDQAGVRGRPGRRK